MNDMEHKKRLQELIDLPDHGIVDYPMPTITTTALGEIIKENDKLILFSVHPLMNNREVLFVLSKALGQETSEDLPNMETKERLISTLVTLNKVILVDKTRYIGSRSRHILDDIARQSKTKLIYIP